MAGEGSGGARAIGATPAAAGAPAIAASAPVAAGAPAIAGDTAVVGLIGHPVAHSLSPAMQNAGFAACGLSWVYVAFDVDPQYVADAIRGVRALGLRGLNVTAPYKGAGARLVDRRVGPAAALGLVNTIVFAGGEAVGYETDGAGFLASCADHGLRVSPGLRAVVAGAGGAGVLIAQALLGAGARVVLANRDPGRLEEAAARLAAASPGREMVALPLGDPGLVAELAHADLFVNATSSADLVVAGFEPARLPLAARVADVAYRPPETLLLRAVRGRGLAAWNGLGMLVHQGAASFTLWTGVTAPIVAMARAVGYTELAAQ